jgi:hypothetical protein
MKAVITLLLYCLLLNPFCAKSQEENAIAVAQGKRYISFKIKAVDKYNARLKKEQEKLLKKLKRKEQRLAHKLKSTDSAAYARFQQRKPSYDSIGKMMDADSATMAARAGKRKNSITDSLKGVESFIQVKASIPGTNASPLPTTTTPQLNQLQTELNYRSYINGLITQRTQDLKSMAMAGQLPGFTGIEKQVYYGKAKMNVYKEMEEDPTKAEDKALEYLQGTEGFSGSMNQAAAGGAGGASMQGLSSSMSAADMSKMGFQTQDQVQQGLQQKFGSNLGGLAGSVGSQITSFQSQAQGITGGINDAKQTLQSAKSIKNINKPSFKVNPMRGLPFWKRVQKQYTWQTTKATVDGTTGAPIPAMLTATAMMGYKQTPKLVYGVGVISALGLGQSWSDVHLSWQGAGFTTYTTWQWQYGIGTYAGYERMYKQVAFTGAQQPSTIVADPSPHNTDNYSESILIGLTKSYNINSKWNGSIQLLYDIWWQQKGLASPIVIRFATLSK